MMIGLLNYIKDEIQNHIDSEYKTNFEEVLYSDVDNETLAHNMYDVGRYETLLELKEKIEEVI